MRSPIHLTLAQNCDHHQTGAYCSYANTLQEGTHLATSPTKPLEPMRCTVSFAALVAHSRVVPAAHNVASPLKICPSRISWILCRASSARAESGKEAAMRRMLWATLASWPAANGDPDGDLSAAETRHTTLISLHAMMRSMYSKLMQMHVTL